MLFFVISDLKVTFCTKPHFNLLELNSFDSFDLLKTIILKDPDMGVQEIVLLLNFVTYLWFASYVWPFCLSDWIFKSLLPVTIGLIRALGRFGFPDNYLITRLFPQEAPPPSPASQLVTTKQSFSNFRYLFI